MKMKGFVVALAALTAGQGFANDDFFTLTSGTKSAAAMVTAVGTGNYSAPFDGEDDEQTMRGTCSDGDMWFGRVKQGSNVYVCNSTRLFSEDNDFMMYDGANCMDAGSATVDGYAAISNECAVEEDAAYFDDDGVYRGYGWKVYHRRSGESNYRWLKRFARKWRRAMLNRFCGTNGGDTILLKIVNNAVDLCTSGYCDSKFGSMPNCEARCDGYVAERCMPNPPSGQCDLAVIDGYIDSDTFCSTGCSGIASAEGCSGDAAFLEECEILAGDFGCFNQ